jgi:putative hydrolase of HD superfamily
MALVHDLAEAVCGDIAPSQNMSKEAKHKLEYDSMIHMLKPLSESPAAVEIMQLWNEYESAETKEALFIKDVDKFEMILQAFEYEQRIILF